MAIPRYSIVIPTYRRGESLAECLESVCALDYALDTVEVVIIDNGGADHTASAADPFKARLHIRYLVNPVNRGYGFSVNRGIVESTGDRIMLLNDDARLQADLLREADVVFDGSPSIGCVGCRAIEAGYERDRHGIGRILDSGHISANFTDDCGTPIDVDHVYGFCYLFTREAVRRAGLNDRTLLAKPYSSGDRIETDHCLSIRRSGLRVIYNPRMVATHLAKPRPDMSEVSLRWYRNAIRNTIYLFLKHYGPFGKRRAALRLTLFVHVGVLSMLRRPNRANIGFFLNSVRARTSAWWHWCRWLAGPRFDSPEAFRQVVERDARLGPTFAAPRPQTPTQGDCL